MRSGRFLLIDDAVIHTSEGLTRTVHQLKQHPDNPLMVQDRIWECDSGFRFYPGIVMWSNPVIRDPKNGKFRMWYSAYCSKDEQGRDTSLLLYAESDDGIHWTKPNLGIIEWNGSRDNNIVLVGITDGKPNTLRYLDTPNIVFRPEEPEPANHYRLFAAEYTEADVIEGVWLYRSPDGFNWELVKEDAVPMAREFNSFFWDEQTNKYVGTVRYRRPVTPRHVGYSESDNGVDWTTAEMIISPEDLSSPHNMPGDDVYGLVSFPYESHYLGFLHTHHTDRRLEVQLMSSTDAKNWSFVGNGEFVLPCDPPGGYGQGMMSTMSGIPIRVGDELWVYIGLSPKAHSEPTYQPGPGQQQRVIGLATIRVDGFASMDAPESGGTFTTVPVESAGALHINADAADGEIRASILDEDGNHVSGLSDEDCVSFTGNSMDSVISWGDSALPLGKKIRVKFHLVNASIYSFWLE